MPIVNKSILLVEDNEQDEALVIRSLKKINIVNNIVIVRDGQQALDYLFATGDYSNRSIDDIPVVVLLDISLPRISGLDVLARVRANPKTQLLPVVILTSSDEERDRLQSYRNGCNSFIRKPLDFGEFAATIAQLGVYWCATNLPPQN